jgi:nucleotide-binding universal stress UspA family protein
MNDRGKTLIAAVDQTQASKEAYVQAMTLAASMRARLVAVSVMPRFDGNMYLLKIPDARALLQRPFEESLKEAADEAASRGLSVKTILGEGLPSDGIVDAAESEQAGLIILGNKRRNYMERVLVGRTAAKVIGHSPCDALLIPEGTSLDFSRILVAVDGSKYSMVAAQRALDLALSYGGEVFALSVIDVSVERSLIYGVLEDARGRGLSALSTLAKQGEKLGVKVTTEIREGTPYKMITDYAEEVDAGLLALGTYGKTALRRLLMGSVVERALVLSPCPVLVVKSLGEDGVRDFV